jgi:enoyl-CoA hydratase
VTAPGEHVERALALAEQLAGFPQETMLADRRAAIEGIGMPFAAGLELEHRLGRETLAVAARGAARFASGEGRGGASVAPDAGTAPVGPSERGAGSDRPESA